jgi:RHS repeat-associated protein
VEHSRWWPERSTASAYIQVKAGGADIIWPGAAIASNVASESWTEQTVTIPTGATTLQAGVNWNTVVANEIMYVNEFEITKLSTTAPEYQYHLKDHLGNVRTTFTTVTPTDQTTATLEAANLNTEQGQFLRIATAKRVNATIFDKTNGAATGYSERLNGSANEKYGVAKSLSVMPGDVINAQVYGKYVDQVSSNWTGALTTLMNQIAANTAGVVVDGASYASSTSSFPFAGLQSTTGSTGGPKAYLNWLIFDRNYVLLNGGYTRMSATPKEQGQDVAHELMASPTITITQPGYIYIYLSNEETSPVEVYFDDFRVTQTKSAVVQVDDYYQFGLAFNSYSRENSVPNRWKFQGQEHVDELGLGWDSFKWRNHQPEIGRFFNVDPLSEKYYYNSTYAFSENKVTSHIELEGLEGISIKALTNGESEKLERLAQPLIEKVNEPLPAGAQKVVNGGSNILLGVAGAAGAALGIGATQGAGAALGLGTAFALSLGTVSIGLAQVVDGATELISGKPTSVSGDLQGSSNLPGLAGTGSQYYDLINAAGDVAPTILTGGPYKAVVDGVKAIKAPDGILTTAVAVTNAIEAPASLVNLGTKVAAQSNGTASSVAKKTTQSSTGLVKDR